MLIIGDDDPNTLTGKTEPDEIHGRGGDDEIHAKGKNDKLYGEDGNDLMYGDSGDDTLIGGAGDDLYDGGTGYDRADFDLVGTGVTIDLRLTTAQDTGDGLDTFVNVEGVNGTGFDDILVVKAYSYGNDGNDTITLVGAGASSYGLDGGGGNDILTREGDINTTFDGQTGNDSMTGSGGNFRGGEGNDIVYIQPSASKLSIAVHGGAGQDMVNFSAETVGIYIDLKITNQPHYADREFVYLSKVERITGTAFSDEIYGNDRNNVLVGGSGDDYLYGDTGNDRLTGNSGNDFVMGGAGDDRADGGPGYDTYSFAQATNGIHIDLGIKTAQDTGEGIDTITNFENITATGFDDDIVASGRDNYLVGGDGIDTVSYARAHNSVTVDLDTDESQNTGDGVDTLISFENLTGSKYGDSLSGTSGGNQIEGGAGNDLISGGNGSDILMGGDGDDYIEGGQGSDTIDGGAGDDTISAGTGSDSIDGGAGIDTLSFADAGQWIRVDLGNFSAQGTNQGTDAIAHIENVIGSAFGDRITGSIADNRLEGWTGDDTLTGGLGADTFVFSDTDGNDVVTDFSISEDDMIELASEPVSITSSGGDTVIDLGGGNTVTLTGVDSTSPGLMDHIHWPA